MESLILYLLKTSALLIIFYLAYELLLKKETSFKLNRKFLFFGILTSSLLPSVYFTRKVIIHASNTGIEYIPTASNSSSIPLNNPIDWWDIAGYIYLIITGLFLLRFIIQLSSVFKIILSKPSTKKLRYKFIRISENQLPFSFFNYIVFNPQSHSEKNLALIIEHEKVHANQFHSVDILLANLCQCLLWFNPFSWLYKRRIEQNLEFIADRETVNNRVEIKEYQHALVKVSIADLKPALTNHFYQSFIKKRILMLNANSSQKNNGWKISLVLPILFGFMLFFNVKTEAQIINKNQEEPLKQETGELDTQIEVTVSKKSTRENLDHLKAILAKANVEATFENLNFSHEKLTSIRMAFEDLDTGNSGDIHQEDENGIKGFSFYKGKDQVGFGALTEKNIKPEVIGYQSREISNDLSKMGSDPLYVVNGKTFKSSKLKDNFIGYKTTPVLLSAETAMKKYGKAAKGGAIIIKKGAIIRDFNKEMKKIEANKADFSGKYIAIGTQGKANFMNIKQGSREAKVEIIYTNKNNHPVEITGNGMVWDEQNSENERSYPKGTTKSKWIEIDSTKSGNTHVLKWNGKDSEDSEKYVIIRNSNRANTVSNTSANIKIASSGDMLVPNSDESNIQIYRDDQTSRPLYVVDEKIQEGDFSKNTLDPANIELINVLKDKAAIEKYGQKAKNGVIEIYTKNFKGELPHRNLLFSVLKNSYNDSDLGAIKEKLIRDNIEVNFSDIKRNSKGIITNIKISSEKEGQKASASYSRTEGIPDVTIGFDGNNLIISSNK